MRNISFIAWHDVRIQLRDGGTLAWLFVMPPIFFFFIGTVMSGFSSGMSGGAATPLAVVAKNPGFLQEQLDLRLRDNDFAPEWYEQAAVDEEGEAPQRTLTLGADFSAQVVSGEAVDATYDTESSALLRDFETIRIQRSLYTALADIVTADAQSSEPLDAAALVALNAEERVWQLDVAPAGQRQEIPVGFEQAVPGILVMFTLLVLLTSGGQLLVVERLKGLLRRVASAPMSRAEVVAGKWGGRMILAALQVGFALLVGTFLFRMDWGPDLAMILLVLAAWAAFCASAGLLLGSLARTEGQAAGLGVLIANVLAALGGCWWPIEVTPEWMQGLQKVMPTGWTMDALHKLISFQSGAAAAVPNVVTLLLGAIVVGWLAVRSFRYE